MVIVGVENYLIGEEIYLYYEKDTTEFVNVEVKYKVRSTRCPAKANTLNLPIREKEKDNGNS